MSTQKGGVDKSTKKKMEIKVNEGGRRQKRVKVDRCRKKVAEKEIKVEDSQTEIDPDGSGNEIED